VIHYVVTGDHAYTIREFLGSWARDLRGRVRFVRWEQARWVRGTPAGAWVLTDLERLTPRERAAASALRERLAAAGPSVRVLNDPATTLRRYDLLRTLAERGVNRFGAFRLAEAPGAVRYPAFLHAEATHDGALSGLLGGDEDLARATREALAAKPGLREEDLLVVEYVDARDERGLHRKYAALRVGSALLPRHVLFSRQWCVKDPDVMDAATLAHEEEFLRDFPHREEVARVLDLARVDYGRIDYAVVDGRVQVFEVNTNPIVVPAAWRLAPERRASQARSAADIARAFAALDEGLPAARPPPLAERVATRLHRTLDRLRRRPPRP
jgi:hypothetical protein